MIDFQALYYRDSYLKEFEARVLACEGPIEWEGRPCYAVRLSESAFYPEGGGQPGDRGYLNGIEVRTTLFRNGKAVCLCAEEIPVGTTVQAVLDFERRFDFMQQHSGEHLISGLAKKHFGATNVGFHISERDMTIDLDLELSAEQLRFLETEANEVVFRNQEIRVEFPDMARRQSLDYRSKIELDGELRLVVVDDVDCCACCGTHLKTSAEIGLIKLLSAEKYKGGLRLVILCGRWALADYRLLIEEDQAISRLFSAKPRQLLPMLEQLHRQLAQLKEENRHRSQRILSLELEKEKGKDAAMLVVPGLDKNELKEAAKKAARQFPRLLALLAPMEGEEKIFRFVFCSERMNLEPLLAAMKNTFPLRGGGSLGLIQGQIEGRPELIRRFLAEAAGIE